MKIKSEIIWALLLVTTASLSFYFGVKMGNLETEEFLRIAIENREEKIQALENKIQQLSEELTSRGIFSYPQASIITKGANSSATVLINLNGRDAIENLEIERKLIQNYSQATPPGLGESSPKGKRTTIGTLNAHNPVAFEIENFNNEIAVDLIYRTKKDQWQQYLRAHKTPEGEVKTFWIITNYNNEIIDKHIDEGFPVDEEGRFLFSANRDLKYSDIRMNTPFLP